MPLHGSRVQIYWLTEEGIMDAVFCTNYPEYAVALELTKYLKKKNGYSISIPLNRQQEGYDLLIYHRHSKKSATIQIKGSRLYSNEPPKRKSTERFHFGLWFNNFEVNDNTDFYVLFGLYRKKLSDNLHRARTPGKWWEHKILIFSYGEMNELLRGLENKSGGRSHSFYLEFNENERGIYLTRGKTVAEPIQEYLLEDKIQSVKKYFENVKPGKSGRA